MGNKVSHHGATPSHGNPASTNALNTELNNVARNTDDTNKARRLVAEGADLALTNISISAQVTNGLIDITPIGLARLMMPHPESSTPPSDDSEVAT